MIFSLYLQSKDYYNLGVEIISKEENCLFSIGANFDIWCHTVVTWDGERINMYYNAHRLEFNITCNATKPNSVNRTVHKSKLSLGGSASFDELAIWNKVFEEMDVYSLYTSYLGTQENSYCNM